MQSYSVNFLKSHFLFTGNNSYVMSALNDVWNSDSIFPLNRRLDSLTEASQICIHNFDFLDFSS